MFRHTIRQNITNSVNERCLGDTGWFCEFATKDISSILWAIFIPLIAIIAVFFVYTYIKDKNKLEKAMRAKGIKLDDRALHVYDAIKTLKTTSPYEIVRLGNLENNSYLWIAGLDEKRVKTIIEQLIEIGYLSKDGTPIT